MGQQNKEVHLQVFAKCVDWEVRHASEHFKINPKPFLRGTSLLLALYYPFNEASQPRPNLARDLGAREVRGEAALQKQELPGQERRVALAE